MSANYTKQDFFYNYTRIIYIQFYVSLYSMCIPPNHLWSGPTIER